MFEKNQPRYLTKGVDSTISLALQIFLWELIDNLTEPRDYLQIFELSYTESGFQKIVHKQEQPEYIAEYVIIEELFPKAVNAKIYVIDDEDHATMLLDEEY